MSSESTNNNNSSTPFRVSYSNYVADITGNPRPTRPSATTGIGHHINPLHNPYPNQKTQPTQQTGGMPQYGGGTDKCGRCSKTVYAAERKVGASRSFHISCFSCNTCHRKLDSTNLSEHKGEIYCKPCYTKQFGGHGVISGIAISTEHTTTKREPRRPSHGDEIESSGTNNQQIQRQTYSKENVSHDRSPVRSPQPNNNNNIFTEQTSPSKKSYEGVDTIVDTKYQRSPSPSKVGGFNANEDRHRSSYLEEDDRNKYAYEGQKLSYGSGASAVVDLPIIQQNKPAHSIFDQYESPIEPPRDRQQSRSPSVKSNDSYRQQLSRERSFERTDEYSHSPINNNPSSTYETQRQSSIHSNISDREERHSRESSPPFTGYRNRSPSPITGYNASSTTRTPASSYVQNYDYQNSEHRSKYDDHRSPSPQSNDRISSGLADFIAKTNLTGNVSLSNEPKNSALGALVGGFRQYNNPNDDLDD